MIDFRRNKLRTVLTDIVNANLDYCISRPEVSGLTSRKEDNIELQSLLAVRGNNYNRKCC